MQGFRESFADTNQHIRALDRLDAARVRFRRALAASYRADRLARARCAAPPRPTTWWRHVVGAARREYTAASVELAEATRGERAD